MSAKPRHKTIRLAEPDRTLVAAAARLIGETPAQYVREAVRLRAAMDLERLAELAERDSDDAP